ncbi:hypothetical protein Dimus_004272 [Dionaea muscipula]
MDALPEMLLWEILRRVKTTVDRNSLSLACKRLHEVDGEERQSLRVGCGLDPANEALNSLCQRFPNLTKVEITYSGWMSKLGKQLDDMGLLVLSNNCPSLTDLTLSYCASISDMGLGHLASCSRLSSLKLNFLPRITECGILPLVMGCKKLTVLHLIRCENISYLQWAEYLHTPRKNEELSMFLMDMERSGFIINHQRRPFRHKFGHPKLMKKFGHPKLMKDISKVYDKFDVDRWQNQWFPCDSMLDLSLVNCIISPGRGLSCLLDKCKNLENIHLEECHGLRDSHIVSLAEKSTGLRSISLCAPSAFADISPLTDESLKALALNCSMLGSVKIAFSLGDMAAISYFTLHGILCLMERCPVRELSLDHVTSFNDVGMEALRSANWLESLELVRSQEVSDEGIKFVAQFARLHTLRLRKCLAISDVGLKPLVGTYKLGFLSIEHCPKISEGGVHGAAISVSFKQDLRRGYREML